MYASIFVAVLAGALGASPVAPARETPPAPGTPKEFKLPPRQEFTLPNGMAVTLVPYGNMPKVDVQLAVRTGNVHEGPKEAWLADLTVRLLQEGTTTRSAEQLAQEAARMGGTLDVGASADETTFGGTVLADFAPQFVALVADVARHPKFPASELERVRNDLARELTIQKSRPGTLSLERFHIALYPDHPYGRLFPTEPQLKGYTLEQVRGFYDANFSAARSHLYVVGQFDGQATEKAIREAFGDWQKGPEVVNHIPKPASQRAVHLIDRPGAVQSSIRLGLPAVDPSHPDSMKLLVTNSLLGGSFASRITSNIREQKGYTYSPFSSVTNHYRDAYWSQVADVTTNVTGASLKEIFLEVDRLRAEAPSEKELAAIKNYVVGTFVLQSSARGGLLARLRFADFHGLPDSYLENYIQDVLAVTPADVQKVARDYLKPDKMAIVVVGDKKVIEKELKPFGKLVVVPAK